MRKFLLPALCRLVWSPAFADRGLINSNHLGLWRQLMHADLIRRIALVPVGCLLLAFAACDVAPGLTSPQPSDDLDPQASHVPGQPLCHDVHGQLVEVGSLIDFTFEGVVSGSLEGTTAGAVTETITNPSGNAPRNSGSRTYFIDGGDVPELIGSEFTVDFVGITVGDLPVVRVTERSSATEGVEKANLTGFGTITVDFPTLTFTLEVEYDGVVCP